jgi:hypothetical protein
MSGTEKLRRCRDVKKRIIAVIPSNEHAAPRHDLASSCLLRAVNATDARTGGYAEPDCHCRRNPSLTSSPPGHTRVPHHLRAATGATDRPAGNPVRAPPRQSFGTARRDPTRRAGSHLESPLRPGRPVLTRGVSRRGGSVAYIRADASPNEVLPHQWTPTSDQLSSHCATNKTLLTWCPPRRQPNTRGQQLAWGCEAASCAS